MITVDDIAGRLRGREQALAQRIGEARVVKVRIDDLMAEVETLGEEVELMGKTSAVLHELSTSVQERFLNAIEKLISEGLTAVFEVPITFRIKSTTRNRQVNLDFELENEDGTTTDLMDARGGGLVSLCGVLLRVVMVRLMADRVRQIMILDEPLGMLSAEYQPAAGELLRKLAHELGIQIIVVSHNPEMLESADKAYELVASPSGVTARIPDGFALRVHG